MIRNCYADVTLGAFRKGKSFLLDWFLRYLLNEGKDNWMGEEEEELTGLNLKSLPF